MTPALPLPIRALENIFPNSINLTHGACSSPSQSPAMPHHQMHWNPVNSVCHSLSFVFHRICSPPSSVAVTTFLRQQRSHHEVVTYSASIAHLHSSASSSSCHSSPQVKVSDSNTGILNLLWEQANNAKVHEIVAKMREIEEQGKGNKDRFVMDSNPRENPTQKTSLLGGRTFKLSTILIK